MPKIVDSQTATTAMVRKQMKYVLVRNHLLCPYSDCVCHERSQDLRIQVILNQVNDKREVRLRKTIKGKRERTSIPYNYTKEICSEQCPYCLKPVEVVVDETHGTRYIHLRLAS